MTTRQSGPLRVTVITAALNAAHTLAETIASVLSQDYPETEYILVDGGSTDATLGVIDAHRARIDRVITGPDSGIAEAMNKGLGHATGDLVLFLHAEDRFATPQSLSRAVAHIADLDHVWAFDILFGHGSHQVRAAPRPFNYLMWLKNPLPHQGVLCPRRVFDMVGPFDQSLRIDMDYDFWLRVHRAGIGLRRVHEVLAVMGDGGISSRRDWHGLRARFNEERRVQWHHSRDKCWRWVYGLYWPLYLGYRSMRFLLKL